MTQNSKNIPMDTMDKFEEVELKIGQAVQVLMDLTNLEAGPDKESLDYIACALSNHSKKLTQVFNTLHAEGVEQRGTA